MGNGHVGSCVHLEDGKIEIDGNKLRIVGNRVWYDYLGFEDYTRLTDERRETYIINEKDIIYKKEWIWFGKEAPWIPEGYYKLKDTCIFDAECCGNFIVMR